MKTVVARGDNDCFVLLWYFTTVDSLVFLPKYSIIIKFKLHNSGFGLSASAAYSPIDWVRLCSVAELNRTQSNGLSTIRFDLFGWVRLARKSYSHRFRCSIWFDCRTQSNSIDGLGSIEFDFRTFDLLSRAYRSFDGVLLFWSEIWRSFHTIWYHHNLSCYTSSRLRSHFHYHSALKVTKDGL